ncbi:MAG: adenylate/guanylate cyclase domain-containing protein [Actinomycetales bacterium]|nr:adenylate/guanylate cyclase domain-containing protein [Candidatus Phosphoribacter baldrii]
MTVSPAPQHEGFLSSTGAAARAVEALDGDDVASLLVGTSREFSRNDVSRLAGVSVVGARKFWHALGFPSTTSSDRMFTEADLRALRRMTVLVRSGVIDEDTALALTRAFARNTDRLAAWQVQLIAESMTASGGGTEVIGPLDEPTAQATARVILDLADELEPMLVYAWRRHLADAVSRLLADVSSDAQTPGQLRCVGFADLVSFTTLVRQLSERDLARTVQRFEALATDVVTAHGGRVIKTVGDEVLFATQTPAPGAAIALDLVDALADDDVLPDLRVGVAFGRVVSRLGDVFGTTVNRAARLTALAHPNAVLVDGPLATALASQSGFRITSMRRRTLRGVGSVTPHVLARSSTPTRRGRYL